MAGKSKRAKRVPPKKFMVYFPTLGEYAQMRAAAAKEQRNPNPNMSDFARLAIRERTERVLGEE